jgi:hypothetical protein
VNVWNVHYPSLGDSLDSEEKRLGPYPGVTQTSDQLLQVVKEYFFCAQIRTKVSRLSLSLSISLACNE